MRSAEPLRGEIELAHEFVEVLLVAFDQVGQDVTGVLLVDVVEGSLVEALNHEAVAEVQGLQHGHALIRKLMILRPITAFYPTAVIRIALDLDVIVHGVMPILLRPGLHGGDHVRGTGLGSRHAVLLGPVRVVFHAHIPLQDFFVRHLPEPGRRLVGDDRRPIRMGGITGMEELVVGKDDLAVLRDAKVHLQGVHAQLHGIEHGRKGLLRIQAHTAAVRLHIHHILRCFRHGSGLHGRFLRSIDKRRLHRIVVGNIIDTCIRLADGLELLAALEAGIEDIVDGRTAGHLAPVMPGNVVVRHRSRLAGILHELPELGQARIVRVHVHVAGEDHRISLRIHLPDLVHQEQETVLPGFLANMVQVRIDEIEVAAGLQVLQERPGGGPAAGGIPAKGGLIRRFGEPVGAPFLQLDALGVIENGHVLAVVDAVLTADAHILVPRAVLLEVRQLEIQRFLHAEHGGMLVHDHRTGGVLTVVPHVIAVFGGPVPDVEGHHGKGLHFLGLAGEGQERQQGCQKNLLHRIYRFTFPLFSTWTEADWLSPQRMVMSKGTFVLTVTTGLSEADFRAAAFRSTTPSGPKG